VAAGAAVPASAAVTVQGASDVVLGLTPADVLLYVEGDAPGPSPRPVRAEASPRYVVRSIAPSTVMLRRAKRSR
jgi:hypothetical protein